MNRQTDGRTSRGQQRIFLWKMH